MKVLVKLFGVFRDYLAPGSEGFSFWLILEEGSKVEEMLAEMKIPDDQPKVVVVNHHVCKTDHLLADGDVVGIFPPMGGG